MEQIIFSISQIIKKPTLMPQLAFCSTNWNWTNKFDGSVQLFEKNYYQHNIYEYVDENKNLYNLFTCVDQNNNFINSILVINSIDLDENSIVVKFTKKYYFYDKNSQLSSSYDLIYTNNDNEIKYQLISYSIDNLNLIVNNIEDLNVQTISNIHIPFGTIIIHDSENILNIDLIYNNYLNYQITLFNINTTIMQKYYTICIELNNGNNLFSHKIKSLNELKDFATCLDENNQLNYNGTLFDTIIYNVNLNDLDNFKNKYLIVTNHEKFMNDYLIQIQEITEPNVDQMCEQINNIITNINDNSMNLGTINDYTELIYSINTYADNIDEVKSSLNIEEITQLETYAENVKNISKLFEQLIIKFNSTKLIDSSTLVSRILNALKTIYDSLQTIKTFKLAIRQQNLLQINSSIFKMNEQLTLLTSGFSYDILNYNGVEYKIIDMSKKSSSLSVLTESMWYFANDLPTNIINVADINYYQVYSVTGIYAPIEFYNQFLLDANEKTQINTTKTIIDTLNTNLHINVEVIKNNDQVVELTETLNKFKDLNSQLVIAQNNLLTKLKLIGFSL